ncbi:type II secretion system protein [Variovorax soli]|uniref:type II secretion system protein n=1 Tax=Variovorax soli TaxID=376815 RepID=UPI00286B61E4|nr:type II secretion system protein [Variovorax soli]
MAVARRRHQRGIGYLTLLLLVFLLSLGAGKAMEVHATRVQREREAELVDVGSRYREAIKSYYLSAPDGQRKYPSRLEDLLKDSRHLVVRRYLRRLDPDPMTSQPFTPLMAPQGGIWGVASRSPKAPLRLRRPDGVIANGAAPRSYGDWRFVYDGSDR